jgi:hypothetical protein
LIDRPFQLLSAKFRHAAAALAIALPTAAFTACQSAGPDSAAIQMETLSSAPLASSPWPFGDHQGTLIYTPHYRLYTTVADPLYQRLLARVLEAAYARNLMAIGGTPVKGPLDCYVFINRSQWEAYTRVRAGSNAPVYLQISAGGYCQEGVFAGYDIGREQTLSVIAHEAWHQYSWFAFKDRLPSWLEEGLATQNEGIEWQGTTPIFKPEMNPRRFYALKAAITENRLWNLDDLAATHAGKVIKLSQKQIDAYYAQLWSLTLFLKNSPKFRPGLDRLLADAKDGKLTACLAGTSVTRQEIENFSERWNTIAGPVYLKTYITPDVAGLQREYEAWIRELTASWPPRLPAR